MYTVLFVVQIIIAIALISIILIQRNTDDGLGSLGGGNSSNAFLSGRSSANLLTRTTAILAAAFMINSLLLANMATRLSEHKSILDNAPTESAPSTPGNAPVEKPATPSVPLAK